jgi:hypothetical protein
MRILQNLPTPLSGTILAATALCAVAFAQTTGLTTIQDTLFKADGTRFTGTLTIQWSTFDSTNVGTIVQQSKTVDVVNGLLQVQLAPNSLAVAPANVYTVHYQSDASQQFAETWTVPPSTTPLAVASVRVGAVAISGGGLAGGSTTYPESAVIGLTSDLAQRPVKGPGFGSGSVAVINQNGQLEAAFGDVGSCVYVDGTSGPCGAATQYFDAETPGGIVDGTNTTFTLANAPSGSSLMLFRNGLYMSANFDYTLNGSTVTFASGAQPQPGDQIVASYRVDPNAGNLAALTQGSAPVPAVVAQVVCSHNGIQTNATVWISLGACDIPASALKPGDRIEVRFSLSHTGTAKGFNVRVNWGNTTILSRQAGPQDVAFAGQADGSIASTGAQITIQSWGTVLGFLPSIVNAPAQNGLKLDIQAEMASATADIVSLTNYTVLRYPKN